MSQKSYTKIEHELRPRLREQMDQAESTEDVRKFFIYIALELLQKASGDDDIAEYRDIDLDPNAPGGYTLSDDLRAKPEFVDVWANSDMERIMGDFAETAVNAFRHRQKHPEKTDKKDWREQGWPVDKRNV
jgi:hypothetical protein